MKKLLVLLLISFTILACSENKDSYVGTYKAEVKSDSTTNYQTLIITPKADSLFEITFTSTNIKDDNEGCTFKKEGNLKDDNIEVPIEEWDKGAKMIIKSVDNKTLEVTTKNKEHLPALKHFCTDGSTLAGEYVKVKK